MKLRAHLRAHAYTHAITCETKPEGSFLCKYARNYVLTPIRTRLRGQVRAHTITHAFTRETKRARK